MTLAITRDRTLFPLIWHAQNGRKALAAIQADLSLRYIPVVILTTSRKQWEVQKCYLLGANTCTVKLLSFDKLTEIMYSLHRPWADVAQLPKCELPPSCVKAG